ncbi:hypothetical protein BDA96_01G221100 [Sorghum bicolor]|uniref:Uncharacterized protein n=2 Tax=Sorghum bicolor TaxID=4558 RepID=A0A921RZG2_SORBI|nr:hypothetical protein BDA96_01G221100 [Sorghum bicolor]OQU91577.1 hypothetical protein SORBI_3001G207666 [Sorghum bicolor]
MSMAQGTKKFGEDHVQIAEFQCGRRESAYLSKFKIPDRYQIPCNPPNFDFVVWITLAIPCTIDSKHPMPFTHDKFQLTKLTSGAVRLGSSAGAATARRCH